jgi:hypothetical protein
MFRALLIRRFRAGVPGVHDVEPQPDVGLSRVVDLRPLPHQLPVGSDLGGHEDPIPEHAFVEQLDPSRAENVRAVVGELGRTEAGEALGVDPFRLLGGCA